MLPLRYRVFPIQYDILCHRPARIKRRMVVRQIAISKQQPRVLMKDTVAADNALSS
jgi:hypothetical protein